MLGGMAELSFRVLAVRQTDSGVASIEARRRSVVRPIRELSSMYVVAVQRRCAIRELGG
jgi:hypothetical protein